MAVRFSREAPTKAASRCTVDGRAARWESLGRPGQQLNGFGEVSGDGCRLKAPAPTRVTLVLSAARVSSSRWLRWFLAGPKSVGRLACQSRRDMAVDACRAFRVPQHQMAGAEERLLAVARSAGSQVLRFAAPWEPLPARKSEPLLSSASRTAHRAGHAGRWPTA